MGRMDQEAYLARQRARVPDKDPSKAKVPSDPQVYLRLVKTYLDTPGDLRIPRAIVRSFQKQLAAEGYQGKVPALSTLECWAYHGVRIPAMARPMSLVEIGEAHKAGEFDLNKLLEQSFDDLQGLSGEVLAQALRQARRVLNTDEFQEKADNDPRIVFTAIRTLDDVNARVTPKAGGEWDLDSVDRERAMEIIAELLQANPDLARAVGNVCQALLDQAAEDAEVEAGQSPPIRAENANIIPSIFGMHDKSSELLAKD